MRDVTEMHQFQRNAVNLMLNCPSAMMLMDMGTGKTVATLTAIKALRDSCRVYGVWIVAPKAVCEAVWAQEADEWSHLTGEFQFHHAYGSKDKRYGALTKGRDVWLTNYENLSWAVDHLTSHYTRRGRRLPFNMVVFDEVSKMANPQATRSKSFKALMKSGDIDRRLGLTATPATNGLTKLFGEYLAIDSGRSLGTGLTKFRHTYFIPSYDGYTWLPRAGTKQRLSDLVAPITYVARAKDLLDLTETTVQDVVVRMPPRLVRQYAELEREYFTELDCGTEVEVFTSAAKSNKCLQFVNGAVYNVSEDDGVTRLPLWTDIHNVKLAALTEIVEEMQGQPLLVMYPFRFDRHRIRKYIPEARDVKDYKNAAVLLEQWNAGEIPVLTGHPGSMGHGLNLQYACSHIVWYGLVWDLEQYGQGNGRVSDRQGQQHDVIIKRIVMEHTMDEVLREVLAGKATTQREFIEAVQTYRQQRRAA